MSSGNTPIQSSIPNSTITTEGQTTPAMPSHPSSSSSNPLLASASAPLVGLSAHGSVGWHSTKVAFKDISNNPYLGLGFTPQTSPNPGNMFNFRQSNIWDFSRSNSVGSVGGGGERSARRNSYPAASPNFAGPPATSASTSNTTGKRSTPFKPRQPRTPAGASASSSSAVSSETTSSVVDSASVDAQLDVTDVVSGASSTQEIVEHKVGSFDLAANGLEGLKELEKSLRTDHPKIANDVGSLHAALPELHSNLSDLGGAINGRNREEVSKKIETCDAKITELQNKTNDLEAKLNKADLGKSVNFDPLRKALNEYAEHVKMTKERFAQHTELTDAQWAAEQAHYEAKLLECIQSLLSAILEVAKSAAHGVEKAAR